MSAMYAEAMVEPVPARSYQIACGFAAQTIIPVNRDHGATRRGLSRCAKFELLARPSLPVGTTLEDWFQDAQIDGRLPELDLMILRQMGYAARCIESDLLLSVNVFPESLECARTFDDLVACLGALGRPASRICIEITEHSCIRSISDVQSRLRLLRQCGFRVALDDFGVGSNHILLVGSGAISEIKLDRAWLEPGITLHQLSAMVDFAHALGLEVIAEGVETALQYACAEQAGCDYVQGHLIGRPRMLTPVAAVTPVYC